MSNVLGFPSAEERAQLVRERSDKRFDEAIALLEYDLGAALERMEEFLDRRNPPMLRFCAAKWILEHAGFGRGRLPEHPPMRPSDVGD